MENQNTCNTQIFKIFLIFIKNIEKPKIIKELKKLKKKGVITTDLETYYTHFKPLVKPLGEFYFTLMRLYIQQMDKKKTKIAKVIKKRKSVKVGGKKSLFALVDKGKEPITGDDFKDWLDRLNEVMEQLYYTNYGEDPTVTNEKGEDLKVSISNPYVAALTMLAALRKDYYTAGTTQLSYIPNLFKYSELLNIREYYNIYRMYMKDYILSQEAADPRLKEARLLKAKLKQVPKEPSHLDQVMNFFEISNDLSVSEYSLF